MSYRARHDIGRFLAGAGPVMRVTVDRAEGSAPRDAGAWMLVSGGGCFGTIGGGALEYMAIDRARALIASGGEGETMSVPLGPEIGQCCGGRVTLALRRADPAALAEEVAGELAALPRVLIFGAGHVGRALARAFDLLPVRPVLIDSREAELADAGIEARLTPLPEAEVAKAPPGSAYLILTHDHSFDFLIAEAALARGDSAYVGMIGSRTKRATFSRWLARQGGSAEALICPIGGASGDKRPEVIAAHVAAEVMAHLSGRPADAAVPAGRHRR